MAMPAPVKVLVTLVCGGVPVLLLITGVVVWKSMPASLPRAVESPADRASRQETFREQAFANAAKDIPLAKLTGSPAVSATAVPVPTVSLAPVQLGRLGSEPTVRATMPALGVSPAVNVDLALSPILLGQGGIVANVHPSSVLSRPDLSVKPSPAADPDILIQSADVSNLHRQLPPPVEDWRTTHDWLTAPGQDGIKVVSGFESSTPVQVRTLSPTHLQVTIVTPGFHDWFMFRVERAKGQTVRIDLNGGNPGDDAMIGKNWATLNPVYADTANVGDPELYRTWDAPTTASVAWNGSTLPSTEGQHWHYVPACWLSDDRTFSFVHTYDADAVTVAMRVPYPVSYRDRAMDKLKSNPHAKVIEVGKSQQGRPLYLVKLGDGDDAGEKIKPCVLIYGGEHADEQDAMWAVQGALGQLGSDDAEAENLRKNVTLLFVPMYDPDGADAGVHGNLVCSFLTNTQSSEAVEYANWFQTWVDQSHRLDLVINLHNVQAGESPNFSCALVESLGVRGKSSTALTLATSNGLKSRSYSVNSRVNKYGWSPDRLGGWLSRRYGALTVAYELNSQANVAHLNIERLRNLGGFVTSEAVRFCTTPSGKQLAENIDALRGERSRRWLERGRGVSKVNAIEAEAAISRGVGIKAEQSNQLMVETWVP